MDQEFVCVVCDKSFFRKAAKGHYVQVRKLCDNCLEIHKWCSWGRHAPLRSQFSISTSPQGDGCYWTCNTCLPYTRGRRPYKCTHCAVEFIPAIGSMHLNGRSSPLCEDCYAEVKYCAICKRHRPRGDFGTSKDKACGLSGQCKECTRAKWHALPANRRAVPKLAKFGLTYPEYMALRESQNDLCAICGKPETTVVRGKLKQLAIDHCHSSGRVRALLCSACNHALGHMQDDPERLRSAADYLEKHAAVLG